MKKRGWRQLGLAAGAVACALWGVSTPAHGQDAAPPKGEGTLAPVEDLSSTGSERTIANKKRPEDPLVTIDWGLGTAVAARRWTPVTVSLTGGLEAFSGIIVFRYRGDSTQSMSVSVPVAATPNKTSVYTPVIAYPSSGDDIEVVLMARSGRAVQRLTYSANPGSTEIQLPSVRSDADPLIVAVGPVSSGAASATAMRDVVIPSRMNTAQNLAIDAVMKDAVDLPTLASAYDGVSAVVVQSDVVRSMDVRAVAALREWVAMGGWLVVVAASGDESWSAWLAPGAGAPLVVAEPTSEEMPRAVLRVVTTDLDVEREGLAGRFPAQAVPGWRDTPAWMHGPSVAESVRAPEVKTPAPGPEAKEPGTPVDQVVAPAARLAARWMKLTESGRAAGWSLGLLRQDPEPAPQMGPSAMRMEAGTDEGLVAQGPVGFGWVTVVGFDPRRVVAQASNRASERVWSEVFGLTQPPVAPGRPPVRVLRGPAPPLVTGWSAWGWASGSNAMTLALDAVAMAEAPGRSVFVLVALAAGAVPLLIGPVDYFVLRRARRAHRSWLTALGWISLASIAAYGAPLLVRSSTTTVSRLNVVDVMMPADASDAAEPLSIATGITGVFAANTLQSTLTGLPAHASVRGVASDMLEYGSDTTTPPVGEIALAHRSPGLEESETDGDRWGGFAPARSDVADEAFGDHMLPTVWRLWTFRAVEDRARIRGTVRATIEPSVTGSGVRVRVTGLAPGAVIKRAAVVTGGTWSDLRSAATPDGGGALEFESGTAVGHREAWEPRPTVKAESGYTYVETKLGVTMDETPGAALLLPGMYERGDRLMSYFESGAWDAVYLHVDGLPASVGLDTGSINREQAVYRIVIPHAVRPAGATNTPASPAVGDSAR